MKDPLPEATRAEAIAAAARSAGGVVVLHVDASSTARDDAIDGHARPRPRRRVAPVLVDADVLRAFLTTKIRADRGEDVTYISPQDLAADPRLVPDGAVVCVHDAGLPSKGEARELLRRYVLPAAKYVVVVAYGTQVPVMVSEMNWPILRA
jgi:hypothetical protein